MTQQPARRHHLVPRFYLARFARQQTIRRRALGSESSHPLSINDATVRNRFYTISYNEREDDSFETQFLNGIERPASDSLCRILDNGQWPLSSEDRNNISWWVALQFIRGSDARQSQEEIYRSVATLEVGTFTTEQIRERLNLSSDVADEDVENIRERMLATADTFQVDHHFHLSTILRSLPEILPLVQRRSWSLISFERKSLGTSDSPLVLIPGSDVDLRTSGVGLGTAAELYIPLSRRVALLMGSLDSDDRSRSVPGTTAIAKKLNQHILYSAHTCVFHHPDDNPFDGLVVPSPRQRQVDTSRKQIHEIANKFARNQGRSSPFPNSDE